MLSEPEPLAASLDDWGAEFEAGERQWVVSNLEFGVRYNALELSVQKRALADMRFNQEGAEFYGRLDRTEPLTPGESIPVHVKVNGFTAQGVKFGYRFENDDWQFRSGLSVLQAQHLMSGSLDGRFDVIAEDDYDFNAEVDYYYYQDPIFKRPDIVEAKGIGWAIQLSGKWRVNENWWLSAKVDDLFSRIRWKDAPYTVAEARTDRKRYDEEGYAIFDPFLSGREGYRSIYYQKLDPRYQLKSDIIQGRWSAHLQGRYQFGYGFAGLGFGYEFWNEVGFKAMFWPTLDAYGVELGCGKVKAGVTLDTSDREEARVFNLNLSYGY